MERIRVSVVKNSLGKSDKELRYRLNVAVSAKEKRLISIKKLIEECIELENNNK